MMPPADLVAHLARGLAFLAAHWVIILFALAFWAVAWAGLRSEELVYDETAPRRLSARLRAFLGSDPLILAVSFVFGIVSACTLVDVLDRWLQGRIAGDTALVADEIRDRSTRRLFDRASELTKRLYRTTRMLGDQVDDPPWSHTTLPALPEDRTGPAGGSLRESLPPTVPEAMYDLLNTPWPAPGVPKDGAGAVAWRTLLRVLRSEDRSSVIKLLTQYKADREELAAAKAAMPPDPDAVKAAEDRQAETAERVRKLIEIDPAPEAQFRIVSALFLDESSRFSEADLSDFALLFAPTEERIASGNEALDFFREGWLPARDSLRRALLRVYAPKIPEITAADPQERQEALVSLRVRLGTSFREPTTKDVARVLASEARSVAKGGAGDRFVCMMYALGVVPNGEGRADADASEAAVDPKQYTLGDSTLEKTIATKLFDDIEKSVVRAVEYKSSGKVPFLLDVSYIRFRSIVRGPIQLLTLAIFFAGLFVLMVKGFVLGFWTQLAYITFRPMPFAQLRDRYTIRWRDIWWGQREIGNADPVTRQVMASSERATDLLPFLLRRVFQSLESGASLEDAVEVAERASVEWIDERAREDVFLVRRYGLSTFRGRRRRAWRRLCRGRWDGLERLIDSGRDPTADPERPILLWIQQGRPTERLLRILADAAAEAPAGMRPMRVIDRIAAQRRSRGRRPIP